MNERIQELALQAKLGPALLLHYYGKVDALTDTEQDGLEQIEKFAELIVRECARYFNEDYVRDFYISWREDLSKGIKDHFGVEP